MRIFCYIVLVFFSLGTALAQDAPFELPSKQQLSKIRTAIIKTNKGVMRFELFPEDAPWHVSNFKYLADKGFYKGLSFDFFHEGYIIQGGAPPNESGPGYSLPAEFSGRKHVFGALGMARRKDFINPERRSNGSQFHILLRDDARMDGVYTVFGQLVEGSEVLDELRKGDVITDVTVYLRR